MHEDDDRLAAVCRTAIGVGRVEGGQPRLRHKGRGHWGHRLGGQGLPVGVGEGAEETHLRDAAESHGGIFIAQQNLDDPVEELDAVKML